MGPPVGTEVDGRPGAVALDVDRRDPKAVQVAYHDWEASTYDAKFGISYDEHVVAYAAERYRRGLGDDPVEGAVLELGGGTGFFTINLALAGLVGGDLHVSDISAGMLEVCRRNAAANDVAVTTQVGDAEALPYADDSFDLVIGHAFIHHLPVPGLAFREAFRVLRPGGRLLIAGEPTYWGDRISTVVKRTTWRAFMALTSLERFADLRRPDAGHVGADAAIAALEHDVDLHTFHPDEVERMATIAGFTDVAIVTEELLSNWWGWGIRTIEGSMREDARGPRWATTAFRGYTALGRVDDALAGIVPAGLFYNLVVSGTKPRRDAHQPG
jgi:ubiquinone/menaquinone biosynthesis C-methylase UbiE